MMRGQAFSTFKLLIAAVVAVAILGILLQILGMVRPPLGFEEQAGELLRDVQDGGVVRRGPNIPFSEGDIYSGGEGTSFYQEAGSQEVHFGCGIGFCEIEEGDWGPTLEVTTDGDAEILACCEDGPRQCYVGVGVEVLSIREKCGI